jgi:ABC-type oligopeptide transport system ATPase subunit
VTPPLSTGQPPLLEVRGLRKEYASARGWGKASPHVVRAVDGVSFSLAAGETFGLVGESGCGKSTAARCILNLVRPTAGEVRFSGKDLTALPPGEMRALRRDMQMVFQDPFSSLDPRMSIRASLLEPLEIHRIGSRTERDARIAGLMDRVGLGASALAKYPHEFSGGQRQRIGIARALATSPRLVVADEPVSALDLSIRAQVINLMLDLQRELGLTYLFIAHDLALVRQICDRVAVMKSGRIVEQAAAAELFRQPLHPYTRRLLEAIPLPDPTIRLEAFPDEAAGDSAAGPDNADEAAELEPELREIRPGHFARLP